MKPTKEILNLLEKRRKYGELTNSYDVRVLEWCNKHNVDVVDIQNDYGCMLTTEPSVYKRLTLERIEES